MSAIATFDGPKAFDLSQKFLKGLQDLNVFGKQTVVVNGYARVFDVQANGATPVEDDVTVAILPSYLAQYHVELLAAVTSGEGDDVFATAVQVAKTLGSTKGDIF